MVRVRMQFTMVGKEEVAFSGWWEFGAVHAAPTVRKQRMRAGAQLTFAILLPRSGWHRCLWDCAAHTQDSSPFLN